MIKDLPKKRAQNVKVAPMTSDDSMTSAGLSDEVKKLKDAFRLYQGEKKVEKMLKDHHKKK